jgi:hypothetical protein
MAVLLTAADPDCATKAPTAHAATGAASVRINARNTTSYAIIVGTARQAGPHHRQRGFSGAIGDLDVAMKMTFRR